MFARINLAKVNQNWRQILRKLRIKDMEKEIQVKQIINVVNNNLK